MPYGPTRCLNDGPSRRSSILLLTALSLFCAPIGMGLTPSDARAADTSYEPMLQWMRLQKEQIATRLSSATDRGMRDSLLARASDVILSGIVDSILPRWVGTEWSYNGTTRAPGTGSIACGYLVTTVLKDAGFELPRVKFAQVPSEVMIRRMVKNQDVRRFSDYAIDRFVRVMREWGQGIYIVGLDYHVGFLIVSDSTTVFCHSSFFAPKEVVWENAEESWILAQSRYRVAGRFLPNRDIVRAWLTGYEFTID